MAAGEAGTRRQACGSGCRVECELRTRDVIVPQNVARTVACARRFLDAPAPRFVRRGETCGRGLEVLNFHVITCAAAVESHSDATRARRRHRPRIRRPAP